MFRQMRRKDREISAESIEKILMDAEYGTLCTVGENGYPYAVPLNYVYFDKCLYFHCAKDGQKLDNIKSNDKVSFCVVMDTQIEPAQFSTKYKSVIAFGTISEVSGAAKELILSKLVDKYSKGFSSEAKIYINKAIGDTKIMKISIQHVTGKQRA